MPIILFEDQASRQQGYIQLAHHGRRSPGPVFGVEAWRDVEADHTRATMVQPVTPYVAYGGGARAKPAPGSLWLFPCVGRALDFTDNLAVQIRPPVGKAVHFVSARHTNDALLPCLFRVDAGVNDRFFGVWCFGPHDAVRVTDLALANEREAAFGAHAVHCGIIDIVFQGARGDHVVGHAVGGLRKVRRQNDQVRALQRQHAAGFGESTVVADAHAHPHETKVVDGERFIAGRGEAVHAKEGHMCLSVSGDPSGWPNQGACVEHVVSCRFKRAEDDENIQVATNTGDLIRAGARNRLGARSGVGEAVEAVAGGDTFREDDQARALPSSGLSAGADAFQVAVLIAQLHVDLDARDCEWLRHVLRLVTNRLPCGIRNI